MENENTIQNLIDLINNLNDKITDYENEMKWQVEYITYVADNYSIVDAEACEYASNHEGQVKIIRHRY